MPLETGTYLPDLVVTNPTHTDGVSAGDSHLRLIKSVLKNTFPNFTDVALASTQAQIDAAVTFANSNKLTMAVGAVNTPSIAVAGDTTTGFYQSATGKLDVTIEGVKTVEWSSAGINIAQGTLQIGGTNVFPLASSNLGTNSVVTAAITNANVTYAKIQNVAAHKLLGNPTGSAAAPSEISLGSGLAFSGTSITMVPPAAAYATNLLVVNDGTNFNTKVNITADEVVLSNFAGGTVYFSGVSASIDTTLTYPLNHNCMGAGAGSRAASTAYFWWLISDGTNCYGLGSKQSTYAGLVSAGDLPSGFTYAVRVGANFTNGSSNLFGVRQVGREATYVVGLAATTTQVVGASPGTVGAINAPTYVSQALTGLPTTATRALIRATSSTTIILSPNSSYGPNGSASNPPFMTNSPSSGTPGWLTFETAFTVYIATNGASNTIFVHGWYDPISA